MGVLNRFEGVNLRQRNKRNRLPAIRSKKRSHRMSSGGNAQASHQPALGPIIKRLLVELGPLLVFFGAYKSFDLMAATAVFMAAVLAITVGSYVINRRLPLLPAVGAVIVLITGGLTLILDEPQFIKMRPTIENGLSGMVVIGSMLVGRPLLQTVMRGTLRLTPEGWRGLTWRVGLFVLGLAVANEVIWRTLSTDIWVSFKVFGLIPLYALFGLAVWPYVKRHWDQRNTSSA